MKKVLMEKTTLENILTDVQDFHDFLLGMRNSEIVKGYITWEPESWDTALLKINNILHKVKSQQFLKGRQRTL